MKYHVISADGHIDLIWLLPDLFIADAAAVMRDRMAYVRNGEKGPQWMSHGGASFGLVNGMASAGREYILGQTDPSLRSHGRNRAPRGREQGHPVASPTPSCELGTSSVKWRSDEGSEN